MDLQSILEHFQTNAIGYGLLIACLVPLIFVTRRYSLPAIQYALETVLYCSIMHVVVGVVVRLMAWFKDQSSMKRAFANQNIVAPNWTTPWLEFWKTEAYSPSWVLYVEIIFLIVIVAAVWRYRPLRFNHGRDRRYDDKGKIISKSARASRSSRKTSSGKRGSRPVRRR